MKTFTARGVVLREIEVNESDKRIVVLLKDIGKILISCRGARKSNSKFLACTQVFTYSDFVVAQGNGFYSLNSGEVIKNFYDIRLDYDRFVMASKIATMCNRLIPDGLSSNDTLQLILYAFQALCGEKKPELVKCAFDLKFLISQGFAPYTNICANCGKEITRDDKNSSGEYIMSAGGVICKDCVRLFKDIKRILLSTGGIDAINYLNKADIKNVYHFELSDRALFLMKKYAEFLLHEHMEHRE